MVDYLMDIRRHVDLRVVSASRESGKVRPPSIDRLAGVARALHDMGDRMARQEELPELYDNLGQIREVLLNLVRAGQPAPSSTRPAAEERSTPRPRAAVEQSATRPRAAEQSTTRPRAAGEQSTRRPRAAEATQSSGSAGLQHPAAEAPASAAPAPPAAEGEGRKRPRTSKTALALQEEKEKRRAAEERGTQPRFGVGRGSSPPPPRTPQADRHHTVD